MSECISTTSQAPTLVLYAQHIPLVYTGALEAGLVAEWLRETHDTTTGIIRCMASSGSVTSPDLVCPG